MKSKLFKDVASVVVVVTIMSFSNVLFRPIKRYYADYPVTTVLIFFGIIFAIYAILKYKKIV